MRIMKNGLLVLVFQWHSYLYAEMQVRTQDFDQNKKHTHKKKPPTRPLVRIVVK